MARSLRLRAHRRALRYATAAVLLVLSAFVTADVATSAAIKKPTSFVAPTSGSAHALTLSTYVTDAADLHYAVVLAGHAPLSASAIKNAAEQCNADATAGSLPETPGSPSSLFAAIVAAGTVRVAKAQKVERRVNSLQPNTSYDVYFVAEVSGSNGVFGPVQSVLRSTTHPEPPTLEIVSVRAANDSATVVEVNTTMSAPGRIYFAFVPSSSESSASSTQLTPLDLVSNRSLSEPPSVFVLYNTDAWTHLAVHKSVDGLTSATLYDVLFVAEAVGDGAVRSDVVRLASAVRTHALPPDVTRVVSAPMNASAEALVVDYDLRFDTHDVLRASAESLAFFSFNVHYEATRVGDATTAAPASYTVDDGTLSVTAGSAAPTDASDSDDVVRGVFPFGNFSSVERFHEQLAQPQRGIIEGLQNGTSYRVSLRAETASSHGLVGHETAATPCATHERAPPILSATASAVNGSVHALAVTAELPRGADVHYLVAPRATAVAVRHHFRDATSMAHLTDFVRRDEAEFVFGAVVFDPAGSAARSASGDDNSASTYTAAFQVDGLRDATAYTIVVMPETHASGGAFGKPFEQLLEAQTNENASDVVLQSVAPVDSTTTSIKLVVEMTKPNDVLYYCVAIELALLLPAIETCAEANRTEFQLRPRTAASMHSVMAFTVANLTTDTQYYVSVFAENALRNGVLSAATAPPLAVMTHKPAPALVRVQAEPVAASTDRITVSVAPSEPCLVHFGVIEASLATDVAAAGDDDRTESSINDTAALFLPTPEAIIKDRWVMLGSSASPTSQRQAAFVSQGRAFAHDAVATFAAAKLKPNTTYTVFVTTETSRSGNASGVYGAVEAVSVTTFALAPKILKAVVDPTPDRIDSVVITANLSAPGVVHYYLSDVDFADPTIIRTRDDSSSSEANDRRAATAPHVLRGTFNVHAHDIAMEIINGTNESRPVEPLMFVNNVTVRGLQSGATYHVSLTTETRASRGVFGDFPPPILVTTHLRAPAIGANVLSVGPVRGSSSALAIELALSRFGDVHYVVFFRELVRDHSDAIFEQRRCEQEQAQAEQKQAEPEEEPLAAANATNATEAPHVWPPVHSTYDLAHLNASSLKAARFDDLGPGVWDNGTITVSRDDVFTGKRSVKEIKGLPPNAVFDVCLVTETAGSDGIFDWIDSAHACQRVKTHADYSNQSMLLDEIAVAPVDAQTGSVRIELHMSKLPGAPAQVFPPLASGTSSNDDALVLERFALAAGRTPFFILADGKDARRDFASNAFSAVSSTSSYDRTLDRPSIGFKHAAPGAHSVVAAGMLRTVESENATFLTLSHVIEDLEADHPYYLFIAYETSGSDGVFARVNAHKHQSNDSKTQNDALKVVTHAAAPALTKFATRPTYGNTSRITVALDVVCASCHEAIVHALVYPAACARPSIDALKRFPTEPDREPETGLEDGEARSAAASDTEVFVAAGSLCEAPLTKRRFVVDMDERDHKALRVEREIYDARLRPNTTYNVFLATETVNSSGVVSDRFVATAVMTFATAPVFRSIHVTPRKGSTTELLLEFELERPGEVHFLGGVSGNPELNVTSPYNMSRKSRPEKNAPRYHDYGRDVVQMQRSVKATRGGEKHVVVLDYLTAGTSYDVYVVAEDPESNGIYGRVLTFPGVSTHANAPILLAHTAYATPGSKASLTVGCRVDAPGAVHISVVRLDHWPQTAHVARGSDVYSNRLAVSEHLVAQASVTVTPDAHASGDSWREVNITVPHAGTNYTVYLVTETAMSDGVFGTVASHRDVRSHGEPPTALKLSVTPADARVDALAAKVELTEAGHVHYVVLPHRHRRSEGQDAVVAHGVVDVVANDTHVPESGDGAAGDALHYESAFVIAPLSEGTVFDIYFRCETLHSHGVFGAWTHFPISARTHGLPPDVLEELECTVSPSCDAIGREQCSRKPNVCGDCLEGFAGALGSSNEPCHRVEGGVHLHKKGPTIKISGVRVNPLAWLDSEQQSQPQDEEEEEEAREQEQKPVSMQQEVESESVSAEQEATPEPALETEELQASEQPSELELEPLADESAALDHNETVSTEDEHTGETLPSLEQEVADVTEAESVAMLPDEDVSDATDESSAYGEASLSSATASELEAAAINDGSDDDTATEPSAGVTACPLHAHMIESGECECMSGYALNPLTHACELLVDEMAAAQFEFEARLSGESARL